MADPIKYAGAEALRELITKTKTALGTKVDKETGKGLSTNDYTTTEKNKLSGIESGAQANVIETVKVDGTALTPSSKAVDINLASASVHYAAEAGTATTATSATSATTATQLWNGQSGASSASYTYTTLNTELTNIRAIAEGKTNTYYVNEVHDLAFKSTNDSISITTVEGTQQFTDYSGGTGVQVMYEDLNIGDIILVEGVDYPDRWVAEKRTSGLSKTVVYNALESRKIDTSVFAKKADLNATITNTTGRTLTGLTETNGVISASFSDISITKSQISDFPPIPQGTVTSVQVQATSPVESSQSTAQTGTLNTTISLANSYGDTKNPYASKTANYVLAAPNGSAGQPTFRALVSADIPSLAISKITDLQTTLNAKLNSADAITASEVDTMWAS